jgi:hypothetical protein
VTKPSPGLPEPDGLIGPNDKLSPCGPFCDRQHEVDEPHNENFKPFDPGVPEPPAEPQPYLVIGKQRVHETPPGEVVHLNPEAPQTLRLKERGQIQPVDITEGDE